MNISFKYLIFLYLIFFSKLLQADGSDIQITMNNAPIVQENVGTSVFTITLSEEADWCNVVPISYTTQNNSATAGSDYSSQSGTIIFYGACDAPTRVASPLSQSISVVILDDSTYEVTENFSLAISNTTTGYQVNNTTASASIIDDDIQPLKLNNFADTGVTETDSDQVLSVIAQFNQNIPSALTLNYHTEDDTALAGTDYSSASGTINVPANSNSVTIPITVKGDVIPESLKKFKVIIDSISSGTLVDNEAFVFINDDDGIQVDITSSDVLEGNSGDSNTMEFKIFLAKDYPSATPLTIDYTTQDGSSPSATAGSDYITTSSSVTFNLGDREKIINVPIIGDNIIEPDENLKMLISGSPYIIDSDSESEILNDDGTYPGVDFSTADLSIVEGNSSTKILNFNFTLDADAIAGSSFEYYTQDDDARTSDNDYVGISTSTYNIPVGTRDINIPVTINGDTQIENDETFYLKFTNENNIVIHGHTARGNIINDDGTYPELSFDLGSYSMVEGNAGQKDLNFTLQLDQVAVAGSSFDYKTEDDTALSSNNDYVKINTKTHTFVGGERSLTIPVKIQGDTTFEPNETFSLKIFNASSNLKLSSSTIQVKGLILNDDSNPSSIRNIGEFRFDDCGADEWKIDHSSIGNNVISGSTSIVNNDDKSYMCTALKGKNSSSSTAMIPHHSAYELDNGTVSMLLYDHHNVWTDTEDSWMFEKGAFKVQVVRVGGDKKKGTIKVHLDGNIILTNEVFFTTLNDGTDLDTQWIHVTISFGTQGMKLYINGVEKGTNPYTGGIRSISDDFKMTRLSGYYDEFYIFEGEMNAIQVDNLYQNVINDRNMDGTSRDCGCYTPSDPFTCDNAMYISSSTNRQNGANGKMWLHKIDTTKNPFDFIVMEDTGATDLYNATAYNPDDNFIYGLYHKELVRLSRGANVTNLGTVAGLPSRFNSKQLYAGAIADGYYYVTGRRSKQKELYRIKLSDKSVTEITLSQEVAIQDFSFYKNINDAIPDNTFLYGVDKNGKLTQINVSNGTVTQIGLDHPGYEFDSSFSDKNGRFFANDSKGNGFFEFNIATGDKNLVSNSQSATFNDGANCVNAALVFNDYGDAPVSYGTAKHNISNNIFMGDDVDHDVYTFNTVNADGDDLDGIDDEDGVTLADGSDLNGTFLALNTLHDLKVKVSKVGYLNVWIDYNIDGDFNDAGENIITARSLTTGTHIISVNVPNGLSSNTNTYLRFRYSSTPNLNPTETATDGEVEDYMVRFGSDALRGKFNIERTDSGGYVIMSDERNAWYTQTVGRDFNYSLVFYEEDFSAEKDVSNVTVKIDLMNMESNTSLYQYSFHILDTLSTSRINITHPLNDLNDLPATKDARFRVTYGVDTAGNIIQENCLSTPALCTNSRLDDAQDNFAIRPEDFYVSIADADIIRKENINSFPNPLRVAAGYDYNLTVIATQYPSNNYSASKGYNANFTANLAFASSSSCVDDSNGTINTNFSDGRFNDLNFNHTNVGKYVLNLLDSTWTTVDASKNQCIDNDSTVSRNPNKPSGCHIEGISDINLSFYPYYFDVDFSMNNLPSSGHDDFIYMSKVDIDDHNVSLQFLGSITAKNEDDGTTTNFTENCFAEDIVLMLDVNMTTDDGATSIKTAKHPTRHQVAVNINRMARFNNEPLSTRTFDNITNMATPLNINANKFLDENNGTSFLDLRYNIQKHLSLPINPVQMTFDSLDANSIASNSSANGKITPNYFPIGSQDLNNDIRNFYFSRVAPDKINYPKVYFYSNPTINTPLNIDIFCQAKIAYCEKTGIPENTDKTGIARVNDGWYISMNHNQTLDGLVQTLATSRPLLLTIAPDNNISFTLGRNPTIQETFNNCSGVNDQATINITPDTSLLYHDNPSNNGRPTYTVSCSEQNASELSGIGETGNIISSGSNSEKNSKIDW
ncbi:MAG: Unknown protein [uncultured Sulfurovum sp.]|uniref:Calx-beta domain-containing protein n=1 Tax=uncultured Sulfurovum sp. TaxID=269237 RepID=A0A6S6UDB3_9BACT|nr:MAG: Unknown protein [uncultured Sulfurovum sp.]